MSKYTAFRCPNDLLRRAKRVADSERRSLSNYIIWLLEEDLIRRAMRALVHRLIGYGLLLWLVIAFVGAAILVVSWLFAHGPR